MISTNFDMLFESSSSAHQIEKKLKATLQVLPAKSTNRSVRLLQQELLWLLKLSSKHAIFQSLARISANLQEPALQRMSALTAGYLENLVDAAGHTRTKTALNTLAQDFRAVPLQEKSVAAPEPEFET